MSTKRDVDLIAELLKIKANDIVEIANQLSSYDPNVDNADLERFAYVKLLTNLYETISVFKVEEKELKDDPFPEEFQTH